MTTFIEHYHRRIADGGANSVLGGAVMYAQGRMTLGDTQAEAITVTVDFARADGYAVNSERLKLELDRQEERKRRLTYITERFETLSEETVDRALEGHCGQYLTMTTDGDTYVFSLHNYIDDEIEVPGALESMADEMLGEMSWAPHALYDLDTGKCLPLNVRVLVTIAEDPANVTEADIP